VGVDIGGTFTDVALEHPGGRSSAKLLTDYERPEARDPRPASPRRRRRPGSRCRDIGQVIHGTTLVTNALITAARREDGLHHHRRLSRRDRDAVGKPVRAV
jgi:N-methylhydantoinase A